jgi:alpha-galactosidase
MGFRNEKWARTLRGLEAVTQVRDIAEVRCDPVGARVYEHGWQSWSPTSAYSLTASPARPSQERWRTLCYRPGVTPPDDRFQG